MFCPNCGTNNEDGAVFCANCGTSLADGAPVATDAYQAGDAAQTVTQETQSAPITPDYNQQAGAAYGQQAYGQPQPAKAPKKPFKISKPLIIGCAAAVVVVVAVIVFICVGNSITSYKKVAEKYVKAVEQCQWAEAYDYIMLPDTGNEFLTEEAFVKAHSGETGEAVASIKVTDAFSSEGNLPGNKAVTVMYTTATGVETDDILLTASGKKMLFFKNYKVNASGTTVEDCIISIPKGLTLTLNGTVVSESYISEEDSSDTRDGYKIPYLFSGTVEISVTSDVTEEYTMEITPTYDEYYASVSPSSIDYDSSKIDSLKSQAEKDVATIYAAAQKNTAFKSIGLTYDSSMESDLEYVYENIADDFTSTYKTISDFKFTTTTASISSTSYSVNANGDAYVKVSLKLACTYKYAYTSYPDKSYNAKDSSSSAYIIYAYIDGQWQMYSMNIAMY